jgi:uncharacterized membrane protein
LINTLCYFFHERFWNRVDLGKLPSEELRFYERIPRTLGKIVTWRIIMTISQFGIGWLSSGNWVVGLGMVGYSAIVNSIIYYLHERVWNKVKAGKQILPG